MLVEEVPGCWWEQVLQYVGGLFSGGISGKKFCTESHDYRIFVCGCNIRRHAQGGSVRLPDLRHCLNLEVHRGVGPAGLVSSKPRDSGSRAIAWSGF